MKIITILLMWSLFFAGGFYIGQTRLEMKIEAKEIIKIDLTTYECKIKEIVSYKE